MQSYSGHQTTVVSLSSFLFKMSLYTLFPKKLFQTLIYIRYYNPNLGIKERANNTIISVLIKTTVCCLFLHQEFKVNSVFINTQYLKFAGILTLNFLFPVVFLHFPDVFLHFPVVFLHFPVVFLHSIPFKFYSFHSEGIFQQWENEIFEQGCSPPTLSKLFLILPSFFTFIFCFF